ncbi:hypothetical protein [Leuconostoc falkenbergense]|uniref:hypothetical protein n=1 Tax=Leuconostoc falkenbergense TaxID=2766470 RepID=UPI0039EBA035
MRTDTISRDDVQDSEITILRQQMASANVSVSNANKSLSNIRTSLKKTIQTGNKNLKRISHEYWLLGENQKVLSKRIIEADTKIEDLNRRVIQLTASLYGLVVAVFVGVIIYAQFLA